MARFSVKLEEKGDSSSKADIMPRNEAISGLAQEAAEQHHLCEAGLLPAIEPWLHLYDERVTNIGQS